MNIATECAIANITGNDISLFEVYNPSFKHNVTANITYMGQWDNQNGLGFVSADYKYVRRANLQGISLNFAVIVSNVIVQ